MSQDLLESIEGGIATLTMNRPEARNALSAEMVLTDNGCIAAYLEALRNSVPAMANRALPGPVEYAQIRELAQRGLARLQQFMDTLDRRLAGREFVAIDRFSIADIAAAVMVDFARVVRIKSGEQHADLRRWHEAMAKHPAFSL